MYLSIILLPLISSIFSGFGGRYFGKEGTSIVACSSIFLCGVFSWVIFFEVGLFGSNCYLFISPWFHSGNFYVAWSFLFDSVTVIMLIVITNISFLVHLYATCYMEQDPHKPRFLTFLNLFTFFMLILVTSSNFIQMFVGWEGVGLASYLLISFWFTRLDANQSAIKALVVNRVGDLGLCIALFLIFYTFQSLDYEIVFSLVPSFLESSIYICGFNWSTLNTISFFLFLGAVGKSSQLGLHTWLVDAMEGPTPVSALLHAATMVTAGVFLLVRCSPLIVYAKTVSLFIALLGAFTAIYAASAGCFQYDLKRVIAFSTTSQLGYMIFSSGLSLYNVSLFHLTNHAFFKALLFLSAGSVIHSCADEQDMRKMGGLIQLLPFTYSVMLTGSLALVGFPFLAGFYSKDFILELTALTRFTISNKLQINFIYWLGTFSVFLTAFYSFRLLFLTFLNKTNIPRPLIYSVHEAPILMLIPLIILAFGSIFLGYFSRDLFIGAGTNFWGTSIFIYPSLFSIIEAEELPLSTKFTPFFFTILGISLALISNKLADKFITKIQLTVVGKKISFILNKRWFWDKINNELIIYPIARFGYLVSLVNIDRGIIEFMGPYGTSKIISNWAHKAICIQTGQLVHYIFFMIVSVFFLISFNHIILKSFFELKLISLFFCLVLFT
uniref:NADH dehydrogenase subunit 5 n=1 Tax=Madagascaria erythrocladioides TaxID=753684 RepID=UPI001FCCDF0C|nr:NADH dehydrogenase subunit 5 [Madagascaria erythrocladioides]UNJ18778.1 NADH dehydrogenase subunit 5 [Madagascaria erythrocladioides]